MTKMLKVKHAAIQVLPMRTRAVATLMIDTVTEAKYGILLAKGSISPPASVEDRNAYMVKLHMDREAGQKTMTWPFVSIRDQMIHCRDVVRLERLTTMNLEFDFKRRPVNPRMAKYPGGEHIAFDTTPWPNLMEAELARNLFDRWREKRCLKTLDDWAHWEDFYLSHRALTLSRHAGRAHGLQVTKAGSPGILQRVFLRAYVRSSWGLKRSLSDGELAEQVTACGCDTSLFDVKNARKGSLVPGVVPRTSQTQAMWKKLTRRFPGLSVKSFFFDG
ncbi:MAG: hypothetical protein RLZZ298_1719 [Pseudomonadota bacterium]|jgi:hypothetical protein